MYNILVYCNKGKKELLIPEFKKYYDYLDVQSKKILNYSNIKKLVRSNLNNIKNEIFLIKISDGELVFSNILEEAKKKPSSTITFEEQKITHNYIDYTPFDKVLSLMFEMSDLDFIRNRVEAIDENYSIGLLEGKLVYKDDFGKSMCKELEKILHTFFKENCFTNLYQVKF